MLLNLNFLIENPGYLSVFRAHRDIYGTRDVKLGGNRMRVYRTIGMRTGLDTNSVQDAYNLLGETGIIDCTFREGVPKSYRLAEESLDLEATL